MSLRILVLALIAGLPACGDDAPIRVAVFQGDGVGSSSENLITALKSASAGKFEIIRLTAEEIRGGKLADVDVLVQPGGSGSKQGKALGEQGRPAVRKHVSESGGLLGVCGGPTWPRTIIHGR